MIRISPLILVFCSLWLSFSSAASAATPPQLFLHLYSPDGRPIEPSRAELLISAWSMTDRLALPVKNHTVEVPLTSELVAEQTPDWFSQREITGQIYIQVPGYAAKQSFPFELFSDAERNSPTEISVKFVDGTHIEMERGQLADRDLYFRPREVRWVQLIDQDGQPVSQVKVEISVFWSNANHCGNPSGAELLETALSDPRGYIPIPDGEIRYMLRLESRIVHFRTPFGDPALLVTTLDERVTPIPVKRLVPRRLLISVTENGEPVSGIRVTAWVRHCSCGGACGGPIAITNEQGEALVTDFYPDIFSKIGVINNKKEHFWAVEVDDLPEESDLVRIELSDLN